MGLVGKATSLLAVAVFGWYVTRIALVSLALFYPTAHIPVLRPRAQPPPGAVFHDMAWQEPFEYEAAMYVSTMESFFPHPELFFNNSERVWHVGPACLSQRRARVDKKLAIALPDAVRVANGTTLYAFLFVQKAGQMQPHPSLADEYAAYARAALTSVRLRQVSQKHALLSVSSESKADSTQQELLENEAWIPHGKARLSWEIVLENHRFPEWSFPLDLAPYLRVSKHSGRRGRPYIPLVWENPIAARAKHWVPLTNQTSISSDVPLDAMSIDVDVSLSGTILGWFRLCNYAHQGLGELSSPRALIQYSDSDVDNLKEMVYEVNPTMLAITIVAMALHILFEFLAYKEDVHFWSAKSGSSLQGISRSSMLMSFASSSISLLYLYDRRKDTNIVVLLGAAAGAIVEAWKLTKVLSISDILPFARTPSDAKPASPKKKSADSSVGQDDMALRERVQRQVDQQTAWYIGHLCIPAIVAYAAFSLVYMQHESYISWFLHVSLASVYTLEFIQMWPQLLINHKLKTVDMLPLTAFLYRFLLTFIDDLYALVVPMPLIERIGTLRDDVVFFVLCYQWYKFPRRKPAPAAVAENKKTE
ncbi:Cleft lip and palate transmembrane protein 1 like protein [Coemansia thaxteri]|uniref:Cleft lip and palate transmembrane protein 1 like protein n=1 Tax=Coemansia thaxteri TaxID=2663907 RepID=A0A9W8EIB5_9FUNG|nr:Cleft lip and palate transmembrane protein 1 like protein [Coemansia thaxteri]KAJ2485800.1 Cleft lip and palate transmembrane protein 1 like protein [Coemansia sp. RSA 2320]